MILTFHLLVGAAIASNIQFAPLALFLAFLSHYFLDSLPHWEYSIKNIVEKHWRKSSWDFLRLFLDISLGILFILLFSEINMLVAASAFLAFLPDILTLPYIMFFPNNQLLKKHFNFHTNTIHFFKNKKISLFWRILSPMLIILIAISFLL